MRVSRKHCHELSEMCVFSALLCVDLGLTGLCNVLINGRRLLEGLFHIRRYISTRESKEGIRDCIKSLEPLKCYSESSHVSEVELSHELTNNFSIFFSTPPSTPQAQKRNQTICSNICSWSSNRIPIFSNHNSNIPEGFIFSKFIHRHEKHLKFDCGLHEIPPWHLRFYL